MNKSDEPGSASSHHQHWRGPGSAHPRQQPHHGEQHLVMKVLFFLKMPRQ